MPGKLLAVAATIAAASIAANAAAQNAQDTLKAIEDTGIISIGYRESSAPFSYISSDQKPVGYSIDLCMEIVEAVKAELELDSIEVKWVPVNPQTRIPLITDRTIQLECGSTTNTLTRQEQVDFSHITFITGTKLVVKQSSGIKQIEDLEGKTLALAQGTTNERAVKAVIEEKGLNTKVLSVKDHAEGFLALETDRADAYSTDHILLYGLIDKAKNPTDYMVVGRFLSYDPYALMVPRNDSPFRLAVNRKLSELFRTGRISGIYEKWFQPMGVPMSDLLLASFVLQGLPE